MHLWSFSRVCLVLDGSGSTAEMLEKQMHVRAQRSYLNHCFTRLTDPTVVKLASYSEKCENVHGLLNYIFADNC